MPRVQRRPRAVARLPHRRDGEQGDAPQAEVLAAAAAAAASQENSLDQLLGVPRPPRPQMQENALDVLLEVPKALAWILAKGKVRPWLAASIAAVVWLSILQFVLLRPPDAVMPSANDAGGRRGDRERCGEVQTGYANSRILRSEDTRAPTARACADRCGERPSCECWSWKVDGFCRIGKSRSCSYVGSKDDARWKFGACTRNASAAKAPRQMPMARTVQQLQAALQVAPPQPMLSAQPEATCPAVNATKGGNLTAPLAGSATLLGYRKVIPILVLAHARPKYLQRTFDSLLRHRQGHERFPLIASQDGEDEAVADLCEAYIQVGKLSEHLRFSPPPELLKATHRTRRGHQRMTAHLKWALDLLFLQRGHSQLVVIEEDMEVAPDFFSYFGATLPLLHADPCLFCVSAWNDNGKPEVSSDLTAVFRTTHFPGLAWMLLESLWREVRVRWPLESWSEHLRRDDVRQGRHCLRPEVPRARTFGEVGLALHGNAAFKQHHARLLLNEEPIDWASVNLSLVASAARFEEHLIGRLKASQLLTVQQLVRTQPSPSKNVADGASRPDRVANATLIRNATQALRAQPPASASGVKNATSIRNITPPLVADLPAGASGAKNAVPGRNSTVPLSANLPAVGVENTIPIGSSTPALSVHPPAGASGIEDATLIKSTTPAMGAQLSAGTSRVNTLQPPKAWIVRYDDDSYGRLTKFFGLRMDVRDHSWRGAYRGVLVLSWQERPLYLVRDWPFAVGGGSPTTTLVPTSTSTAQWRFKQGGSNTWIAHDGKFHADVDGFLRASLAGDGYVSVRFLERGEDHTDVIVRISHAQEFLGKSAQKLRALTNAVLHRYGLPSSALRLFVEDAASEF